MSAMELVTTRYRFRLESDGDYMLDAARAGQVLRGAFGTRFRALCCAYPRGDCRICGLASACAYARVFCPAPPPGSERLRNLSDIPRPYVLKPPLEPGSGDIEFDMVLVGSADQYLPYFIVTWHDLADRGIGPGRVRGRLASVRVIGEGNRPGAFIYEGQSRVKPQPAPRRHVLNNDGGEVRRLMIRFLTPTHLVHEKKTVRRPEFHQLIRRARDRLNALSTFFGEGPLALDFSGLAERAGTVRLVSADLCWSERTRRSSRTGLQQPLVGVVGTAVYEGDLVEFMPLLHACEEVNVGKGAVFGQGWVEVEA